MSWSEEQVKNVVGEVIQKAVSDADFRELALSDIYAAAKEVTGKEIPKEFKINVVDGTGYHANIVLPEIRGTEDELTETDLEMVAGGSKAGATRFFEGVGSIVEDTTRDIGGAVADRIRNG